MEIFNCIKTRRSIRKFKEKKIDKDDLFLLVESGMCAPTSGDLQDFKFIVTQKKDIIQKTADICEGQDWISGATGIIVICSQPSKQKEWYGVKGEHVYATQNAAAAAQNILLCAHAINLGACWIGGFNQEGADDLFGTGSDARVEVIIALGYPDETPEPKIIQDIDSMMFFDKYGNDKSNLLKLNKDYSSILEIKAKEMPEITRNWYEKGKYFIKKKTLDLKKK